MSGDQEDEERLLADSVPTGGRTARIEPANLDDFPSVLDINQVANVLRVSVATTRSLEDLQRLDYSRVRLYSKEEVAAFLRRHTTSAATTAVGATATPAT